MSAPFRHRLRVRWSECDQQGIVFYPHYLAYFDVAITELYRAAIGSWNNVADHGVDAVVAEASVRYRASARFEDEIDLVVGVSRIGTTSTTTGLSVERAADGAPLVEGQLRHVFVDPSSFDKREIPEAVRAALEPYVFTQR